jgi:hypothetical protein
LLCLLMDNPDPYKIIRIREAQKLTDPTDNDPEHWYKRYEEDDKNGAWMG